MTDDVNGGDVARPGYRAAVVPAGGPRNRRPPATATVPGE